MRPTDHALERSRRPLRRAATLLTTNLLTTNLLTTSLLTTGLLLSVALGCGRPPPDTPSGPTEHAGAPPSAVPLATAVDAAPEPPPGAMPWFEDVVARSGIDFVHESGAEGEMLMPEMMVGGVALFDMDGDGDLDLYFVQAGGVRMAREARPGNRLYRNDGGWRFTDVTRGSGADDRGYGSGVATGDFDADGDLDLYVTNLERNALLRNEGGGRFTDVAAEAGVDDPSWSSSAAFVDIDLDGDLDLYVANFLDWSPDREIECQSANGHPDYCGPASYSASAQDSLYRNEGDGTFTDISLEAGLDHSFGNGLGVVAGEFGGDAYPDLFIANDGTPDQLWINQGDGTFVDRAGVMGVAIDESGKPKAGMGVAAADLDADGLEDLLVVNLAGQTDSLYRRSGGHFVDETQASGLAFASRRFTRFGTAFADFDNDGRLDLYQANGRVRWHGDAFDPRDIYAEPNLVLRGGPQGFSEFLPRGGTAQPLIANSRGAAFGDIDDDGRLDVVVVNRDGPPHVLRNIAPDPGHWLMLRVLNAQGGDALGAHVRLMLRDGDAPISRTVRTAYSYCSANDPRVHVGLGEATEVDGIEVHWPDGEVERFATPEGVDRVLELRRGAGSAASE